ncbi:MAG: methyl-accepting chemotaxis protein [Deltaproteobacteria bacterium]|nr:methyl-accepting chemotaxis protein [Deltaproteobacteria bacterium]
MLKKFGLRSRLVMMIIFPTLGLLFFAGRGIYSDYQINNEMKDIKDIAHLTEHISLVVHELQKERGASAGYMGSGGTDFRQVLAEQRKTTDTMAAELELFFTGIKNKKLEKFFSGVNEEWSRRWAKIKETRPQVDSLQIRAAEAIGRYTSTNGIMLDSIGKGILFSTNEMISNQMTAALAYMKGKERAGIERAVLSNVFAADSFQGREHFYSQLLKLVTAQETYLDVFRGLVHEEDNAELQQLLSSEIVLKAEKMRDVAVNGLTSASLGINAKEWFNAQTDKINLLKQFEDQMVEEMVEMSDRTANTSNTELWTMVGISAGVLLATIVLGLFLMRNTMEYLLSSIRGVIEGATESSRVVSAAAQQIAISSQSLASGSSQQASSLEEISATLEEIAGMSRDNAANTRNASEISTKAHTHSRDGETAMNRMKEAISQIKDSSDETAKIIKTIDEIAFQTNLLALNAAVEAARAGDAGRGFAVVAEEVRNLAMRSADAARNTTHLIEDSLERAEMGVQVADEMDKSLGAINGAIKELNELIKGVTKASEEQATGVEQVNTSLTQLEQLTQDNAANSEETAASSQELTNQAITLESLVNQLKKITGGDDLSQEDVDALESYSSKTISFEQKVHGELPPGLKSSTNQLKARA